MKVIVFLGDSMIEWNNWQECFPGKKIVNLGVAGNFVTDVFCRVDDVLQAEPAHVVSMMGVNDCWSGADIDGLTQEYEKILDSVLLTLPTCQWTALSVLPVNLALAKPGYSQSIISDIIAFNSSLSDLMSRKSYAFVDLYTHFLDETGQMNSEYTYDGVHLNQSGYARWAGLIEKLI